MLDYSKLDSEFDKVLNSISDEEIRKWDIFDEMRLLTEKFDELCFNTPIEGIRIQEQMLVADDFIDNSQFCGDNRFALAA